MTLAVVASATPLTETCAPEVIAQALPLVSVITGPTVVTIEQLGEAVRAGVGVGVGLITEKLILMDVPGAPDALELM